MVMLCIAISVLTFLLIQILLSSQQITGITVKYQVFFTNFLFSGQVLLDIQQLVILLYLGIGVLKTKRQLLSTLMKILPLLVEIHLKLLLVVKVLVPLLQVIKCYTKPMKVKRIKVFCSLNRTTLGLLLRVGHPDQHLCPLIQHQHSITVYNAYDS